MNTQLVWSPQYGQWVQAPVYTQQSWATQAKFPHVPWLVATAFTGGLAGLWYARAYFRFRLSPNRAVTR